MSAPRNSPARRTSGFRTPSEPSTEPGLLSLTPERARVLLLVATRPAAFAFAIVVVVLSVTLVTEGGGLSGISGAVAAGWLTLHQVPLVIGTTTLGILPLLPSAVLLWAVARECAEAVEPEPSRADLGWLVGAALGGPLLITAVCLAVAEDASGDVALQPPNPLPAFGWVLGLHLCALSGGVGFRLRHQILSRLPYWPIAVGYVVGHTMRRLLICGAAITAVCLLANWSTIGETYGDADGIVGGIGLTVLSLLYLPNVVVAAVSVLLGAGVQFGEASIDLFSVVGGPVPAVPVLAALPQGPAALWWPVMLVVPAAIAVLGGIDTARISDDRPGAPWVTLASAFLGTAVSVAVASVAGGELGNFGWLAIELPVLAVVAFAWFALAGYVGLVFGRWFVAPSGYPVLGYEDYYYGDDDYFSDEIDGAADYDDDYYDAGYYEEDGYLEAEPSSVASPSRHRGHQDPDDFDDAAGRAGDRRAGLEPVIEVDAELVDDDEPALGSVRPAPGSVADSVADIVDAEVVDADLPGSGSTGGS